MYIATINQNGKDQENCVGMSFEGEAQSLCSKLMMWTLGWMMVGETKKQFMNDLRDIKTIAEKK
jgi:hypothetical protein